MSALSRGPEDAESFYTPQRIEYLLRQLPYLLDRTPGQPEENGPRRKRMTGHGWREGRMDTRADIEWALDRLPPFQRRVVYLVTVGDKSSRDVASIVGKSKDTVRRNRIDGINMMAWLLGWRNEEAGWV